MIQKTNQDLPYSPPALTQQYWTWVHTFVLLQFSLQILLLFPEFGIFRMPMRIASFALSLFLLVRLQGKGSQHPAMMPAILVLGIMLLELCLHPHLNSFTAGVAQCAIYTAILAPLFWVRNIQMTSTGFTSLMFLMWGFQTLSAVFGILQVYYPGQFQPFLSTAVQNSAYGGDNLLITLANGQQIYRPMGLTDVPGGAAVAGFYALLLGVGMALKHQNLFVRIAGIGSAVLGLLCIYLSQVRSILVLAVISMVCLAVVLARTQQFGRLTAMLGGVTALFAATFTWAVAIGGTSTLERITSLFSDRIEAVYQEHRGLFLKSTIETLLPLYPLGAGLGRWGTINNYFGDNTNPLSKPIWVEIQWTGWLLDGGVPLVIAYVIALYFACSTAWKIAIDRQIGDFAFWGGLIFAYNIGALAITFNYPLFISQGGMEFWLLNAALFVAAGNSKR
jgi:hypothetical protein